MKRRPKRLPVIRADAVGSAPGTLTAPAEAVPSQVSVIAYSCDTLIEESGIDLDRIVELRAESAVTWVNIEGLADVQLLHDLDDRFGLHRLALEDTLNTTQSPKLDDYGDHQYIVARMPVSRDTLETEQISVFLGEGFLLTVQERPGDCFDAVRTRLRTGRTRIRGSGPDYLAYAIMDALVDAYFPLLESAVARLEELELAILAQAQQTQITELHDLKRSLITLRRYLAPLRELTSTMAREENPFLKSETRLYMRDCQDHAKHAFDLVESYRDVATGLMDLYLSMMSQRMNEVMKVLTIIATIFIPLSFIAGLYGMNFDPQVSRWNMPELGWAFGYPAALGLMLTVTTGMVVYFWKKGWFR